MAYNSELTRPLTSIVSYPERGAGGNNRYCGNCSPKLIEDLIEDCNGAVSLTYLYEQIEPHKKAQANKWWKEKIRQTLQCNPAHFIHDGRGMWSLNRSIA